MQSQQTKKIIINSITGVIMIGVLALGYWVFFGNTAKTDGSLASTEQVNKIIMVGMEIGRTLRELEGLEKSIKSSKNIFYTPVFKGLEDFSVQVPTENIGRENPFVQTAWKISQEVQTAKSNAQ